WFDIEGDVRLGDVAIVDVEKRRKILGGCAPDGNVAHFASFSSCSTAGNASGMSSAIMPMPAFCAAAPCNHAPAHAASKGCMPCARRPAIMPVSTSPEPAVASHGGALVL